MLDAPTVVVGGAVRSVTRPREQAVLVRLALSAPRSVPVDVLVADVWGDEPPATALDALRVHVSNLRKLLRGTDRPPSEILRTEAAAYRLDVPAEAVDVHRLEAAVASGDPSAARPFLASWPDHDLGRYDAGTEFFAAAARHVDELRLTAAEDAAAADVEGDRHDDAVRLLEQVLHRAPYRERAWELLVGALAGAGRRTEALRAAQRARHALAEVGVEPGPALRAAEASALGAAGAGAAGTDLVTHYVDVDGSRVAYATLGSQPLDLLFLHGGFVPFDTMRDTPRLARLLDELATRFRVVLVDRRGIGMSDGPSDGGPVVLEHWVSDCRAVLDAVGSRQVIVFGHEHAGPVAVRVAAELPERVGGLVLHSTAARPLRGAGHPYGPSESVLERLDRMVDGRPGSPDLLRVVAPSAGDDPQLRSWLARAGRLGAGPARAKELHRLYQYTDVRAELPRVRAPAVVLHPARLIWTDPGQARYLAEHLPDAELVLLDSADHLFWVSDADCAAVLAALDRLRVRVAATAPPARLHAVVAVACPTPDGRVRAVGETLVAHGAAPCHTLDGVAVALFDREATARAAVTAVERSFPDASVALELADATTLPTDPAVRRIADRARARVSPS